MINRLALTALRFRFLTWAAVVLVTVTLSLVTPPIEFDQSIESFFPGDHPALVSYERSKRSFGGDHLVFVVYDDPQLWTPEGMKRVRSLADRLAKVPGVERVDAVDQMPVPWKVDDAVAGLTSKRPSIFNLMRIIGGRVNVQMLVRSVADDPERQAATRKRISQNPLFSGLLVDPTGMTTSLVVRLRDPSRPLPDPPQDENPELDEGAPPQDAKPVAAGVYKPQDAVSSLRRIADEFQAEHKLSHVAVAGPPVLIVDGFNSLERDNTTLGMVAMLLMALTMLLAVRNPGWALLPLAAGLATWEVTKAFMVGLDLKLSLSSGPIVAQTIVLCMPAASHLAVRFAEVLRTGVGRGEAARLALIGVFLPVLWCSITAASGYLAMWAATSVQPVAQFGLTMFACNLIAGALSWLLAAGAMAFTFGRRSAEKNRARSLAVAQGVGSMTEWVMLHPRRTLAWFVAPVVLAAIGIWQLEFESNYINVYRPTARIARDYRFIESRMGGIGLVELVFPAPRELTPVWLERLRQTAASLKAVDPELVSGVVSVADILTLPPESDTDDPERILAMKLTVLGWDKYSHFLTNFWDRETGTMRIIVRILEGAQADRKERCFEGLLARVQAGLSKETFITGLSHLMTQITHAVVITSFYSAGWSTAISLAMLWIVLRSLPLAALALAPTMLAVGLVLGVMGWIGLKIDMSTVFVAAVAIGLSVDDAFHCLLRWKEHLKEGHPPLQALRLAYAGSGAGVILSSAGVSLGFMAMLFSEFMPMFHFGWLVSVATFGGSFGNLVVIPAVLSWTSHRSGNRPITPVVVHTAGT